MYSMFLIDRINMYFYIFTIFSYIYFANLTSRLRVTRAMYNDISILMGEKEYPEEWWQERAECFNKLSPNLDSVLEKAWEGMVKYWENRGQDGDSWHSCDEHGHWFESNCTLQPGTGMAIWEPCNYASNLAYDR